jgi:hypothetical protein
VAGMNCAFGASPVSDESSSAAECWHNHPRFCRAALHASAVPQSKLRSAGRETVTQRLSSRSLRSVQLPRRWAAAACACGSNPRAQPRHTVASYDGGVLQPASNGQRTAPARPTPPHGESEDIK